MLLNVSAKNYKVVIDGLDCTEAIKSFEGNYSHYENESGLILVDAKIVIGKALGFTENLDDRVNRRWERGRLINIYYSVSGNGLPSEKMPIVGTLYILESKFDNKYTLEITAGCLLNLLNFRTPIGDGICFQLGDITNISAIAVRLLTKLRITNYSIELPNRSLTIPLPKLTNESYVSLLGKLAWHFRCIVYQDREGTINIKPTVGNTLIGSLQTGKDDIRYERISSNQYPYEIVKAIGIRKVFRYNGIYDQYSPPDQRNMDRLASVELYFWLNGMIALNRSTLTSGTLIQQIITQKVLVANPKEIFDIQRVIHSQRFGITQKLFEYSKGVDSIGRRTLDANYSEEMAGVILPNLYPFSNQLINSVANITHKQFELKPKTFSGDTVCTELDQGRLLIKVDYVCKPLGVILAKYLENLDRLDSEGNSISEPAKEGDPIPPNRLKTALGLTLGASPFYNLLTTMMVEKMTITTYKYQDNLKKKTNIASGNSFTIQDGDIINEDQIEPVRIEVTTQVWQPEGILYDKINQRIINLESETTDFYTYLILDDIFERSKLRLIELKTEIWQKKSPFLVNPEIWAYSSTTQKTFAESLSDILRRLEDEVTKWNKDNPTNKRYVNADHYHQLYTSETISQASSNGETNPPSPERFNIGETKEKELTGIATFPAYAGKIYRERTKIINVDSAYVIDKNQLNELARLEGQIIIGKFKGISSTTQILNAITRPLDRVIWTDPTFSGVYLVDGCAIACANNRFAMSFDGILWQGGSGGSGIGGVGSEEIEYIDYSDYFEVSDTYDGIIYFSGYINDYPYALETINDSFSGEITLSGHIDESIITPDSLFIKKAISWGLFDPKFVNPDPIIAQIYSWSNLTESEWDNMDELSWDVIVDEFNSWDNLTDEQWDNMSESEWSSIIN